METKMVETLRKLMADLAKQSELSEEVSGNMGSLYAKGLYTGMASGYSLAADMVQDVLPELLKSKGATP